MNNNEVTQLASMSTTDAKEQYKRFVEFTKELLVEKRDFGSIPGISKPSLLKPGAEKLRLFYGLGVKIERTWEVMDIEKDFYDVSYKVTIKDKNWFDIGECEGSCNTYEDNYRFRREKKVKPSAEIEAKKKEDWTGRNRKYDNARQRQERVENSNKIGKKNTIQKMAQKRAYVWAILLSTGASEFFTQDVEDMWFAAADTGETIPAATGTAAPASSSAQTAQPASSGWPISDKQLNFLGSILTRHKFEKKDEILAKMIDKYCPGKTLDTLTTKDWSMLIDKAQDKSTLEFDLWLDELPFGEMVDSAPASAQPAQVTAKTDDDDLPF